MLAIDSHPATKDTWVVDSGASHHVCNNRKLFIPDTLTKTNFTIRLGDKTTVEATEEGWIPIQAFRIKALFVPRFRISCSRSLNLTIGLAGPPRSPEVDAISQIGPEIGSSILLAATVFITYEPLSLAWRTMLKLTLIHQHTKTTMRQTLGGQSRMHPSRPGTDVWLTRIQTLSSK